MEAEQKIEFLEKQCIEKDEQVKLYKMCSMYGYHPLAFVEVLKC